MTRVVLLLGVATSILSTSAAIHMASGGMQINAASEMHQMHHRRWHWCWWKTDGWIIG
jgi:hypothetical protein